MFFSKIATNLQAVDNNLQKAPGVLRSATISEDSQILPPIRTLSGVLHDNAIRVMP